MTRTKDNYKTNYNNNNINIIMTMIMTIIIIVLRMKVVKICVVWWIDMHWPVCVCFVLKQAGQHEMLMVLLLGLQCIDVHWLQF